MSTKLRIKLANLLIRIAQILDPRFATFMRTSYNEMKSKAKDSAAQGS